MGGSDAVQLSGDNEEVKEDEREDSPIPREAPQERRHHILQGFFRRGKDRVQIRMGGRSRRGRLSEGAKRGKDLWKRV